MSDFGIVGYGIVGKATHTGLLYDMPVKIHDIKLDTKLSDLSQCKFVFFCIPTEDNETIERLVEEIHALKILNSSCLCIVRCTVPLGTCERIEKLINDNIIYIPEFLRDRCWELDCVNRPVIIGSNVLLPDWLAREEHVKCSLAEAEVLKMYSNNLAAARIVFANLFYDISTAVGADYHKVLDCYLKVAHDQSYLEVSDNLRAFGGKCLSKDLDFLIESFTKLDIPQTLFTAMQNDNKKWPVTIRQS
jgi:UDP-glucose 6-dehydrogenase